MSNNPKGYNGMRNQFGNMAGVPNLGGLQRPTQEQIQQVIGQRITEMMAEMYMRSAADLLCNGEVHMTREAFGALAADCERAALAFFEYRGLITTKQPESEEPAPEGDDTEPGPELFPAAP